jgi:hypothetical protein
VCLSVCACVCMYGSVCLCVVSVCVRAEVCVCEFGECGCVSVRV